MSVTLHMLRFALAIDWCAVACGVFGRVGKRWAFASAESACCGRCASGYVFPGGLLNYACGYGGLLEDDSECTRTLAGSGPTTRAYHTIRDERINAKVLTPRKDI